MPLNDESCFIRHTTIDLNSIKLKYYSFMISLDKCKGNVNVLMTYLRKYLFRQKKYVNAKVFNMITRMNEAKSLIKHILCDFKCKLNSTAYWTQKWNNDKCQCECRKHFACKKDTCICENIRYL